MSKIALSPNAGGTATFTIASPGTSTDRTLTLPDAAGTIQVSGNPISGTTGTFTGLVDISAAGAGQIQFPATQNASANANTLDDYEEGTWTPTDNSGDGIVFTIVGPARYVKIGAFVFVSIYVSIPSTASGATVNVTGLPFVSAGSETYHYLTGRTGSTATPVAQILTNGVSFGVFSNGSTGMPYSTISGTYIIMSGCYRAAS
jgi:hypothetical protein